MDRFVLAPTRNDFYSLKWLNYLFKIAGSDVEIKFQQNFFILTRKLYEEFNLSISVSMYLGLLIAFPYVIFEIWRFIKPALKPNERKNSFGYIISTIFFFLLGCAFGYFILSPLAIQFGFNYRATTLSHKQIEITDIIMTIVQCVFGMGVIFLLPVFTYALTAMGILTPSFLKEYRRHSIVVILIIAAIITPPDMISMFIASIPLMILYEFSVLVSKFVYKRLN